MTDETSGISTPDQRLRVFVSSVVNELATERARVREAIVSLRLTPVMVELGARPHPSRDRYRAYLDHSDVFIGLYWERYGWVAPGMDVSGVEDEYDLCGDLPRLLYVKQPAPAREPRMTAFLERIEAESLGSYRLFNTPDELVELVRDDLALLLSERFTTQAPAQQSIAVTQARAVVPAPTTPIIGRDRQIDEVQRLLSEPGIRLVTLTGAGGIGKTRLALELGHQSRDHYSGGTVYVQLSAVRSEVLVIPSMATALGVTVERGQSALDAIVDSVQQPVLLIADNLEQIEQVGPQIAQLLSATPMITVLATSRTALRIRGEHEYQVPVLDVGSAVAADVLALAPPPAVQMFVERARASRPGFELTADNASAVAEICRRLDGLPLAIELAAARVRLLSPDALLARLGNRLDTLGSGPADLPERQRTLRATIDWSFSLLDAAAADLMSALAVFNDGWTLEAAAAVCELDELDALVALEALDRQSLILVGDESGEPRFGMLTTVREYAQERLLARPDADDIAARHAAYFLQLLEQAGVGLLGRAQDEWRSRLAQDQGNLRAVLRSLLDRGDVEQACHFIRSIWPFWWLNDQLFEASAWISRAMEQLDGTGTMAQAELLWSAWATALNQGETTHVVDLMHRTLAAANAVDDPFLVAVSILLKSYTLPITGDLDAALDASTQAQRLFSAAGENFMAGLALSGLGTISQMRGDVAAARQYHEQAVTLGRALSNVRLLGQALSSLGMTMVSEGDLDEARRVIDEGAELFLAAGSGDGLNMALSAYALLAAKEGDLRRAAVARGAVEQIRGRIGISVWPVVAGVEAAFVRSVREALGDAEYEDALAEGAGLSRAEAVAAARGIPVSNVRKVDQ